MDTRKLSDAYFEKAINSLKLAVKLLTDDELKEHRPAAVKEIFHGYELLLKSHISMHNSYLLLTDTKNLLDEGWKLKPFDQHLTKAANELPKLLYALEDGSPRSQFLKHQRVLIEAMRVERNRFEHSAADVSESYISLIIAPFFHKVILKLVGFNGADHEKYFDRETRIDLLAITDKPEKLLEDMNKYEFTPHGCSHCNFPYAFVTRDQTELFCLICQRNVIKADQIKFGTCPCCAGEMVSAVGTVACVNGCETPFRSVEPTELVQSCACGSRNIADLLELTGECRGLCLECLKTTDFWACDDCGKYWTCESAEEPPEEIAGSLICENCIDGVMETYAIK